MKVLIVDAKGQIIGDFLSETETQLESDALRYLNTGVARQDSILIAGDKVWSFVESDGVLKCELNQRLTLKKGNNSQNLQRAVKQTELPVLLPEHPFPHKVLGGRHMRGIQPQKSKKGLCRLVAAITSQAKLGKSLQGLTIQGRLTVQNVTFVLANLPSRAHAVVAGIHQQGGARKWCMHVYLCLASLAPFFWQQSPTSSHGASI